MLKETDLWKLLENLSEKKISLAEAYYNILLLFDGIGSLCDCDEKDKTGSTRLLCCNHCGKRTENF